MTTPTTFVVLTTQRSGSGWLVDLLDDHPSIAAYEELFKVTETTVPRHGASAVPTFEVMVGPRTFSTSRGLFLKRYEYLRGLGRAHPGARAVGFKLMYDQTRDHPWLVSMLVLMRARFVHLVRRNSLDAVLSFDIAHEHDRWHHYAGEEAPPLRVRTDPSSLVERIERRDREIERFRRRLARLPVRVHEVVYEDLVERRDEVLGDVLAFLGVPEPGRALRSSVVRPTRKRALERIENGDDVCAALAGTPYESLAA